MKSVFHACASIPCPSPLSTPQGRLLNKEGKRAEVANVLRTAAEALRVLAIVLSPFIPTTSRRILEQLGIPEAPMGLADAGAAEYIKDGTEVKKDTVLFRKIDAEEL